MTDDGQGFAYAAGYTEATKDAQRKIDALVAALRDARERMLGSSPAITALRAKTDAALKAATQE